MITPQNIGLSQEVIDVFAAITCYCENYVDFIERVSWEYQGKKILFVFDPPYFCSSKTYKTNYFGVDEYISLIQLVDSLAHFVFVSYESEFLKYIIKHEIGDRARQNTYSTKQASR